MTHRHLRILSIGLATLLAAGPLVTITLAAGPRPTVFPTPDPATELGETEVDPTHADELLIRYRPNVAAATRRAVEEEHGLTRLQLAPDGRTEVAIAKGRSAAATGRHLADDPRVLAVAPNHRRELAIDVTAEPYFEELWGLDNTGQTLSDPTSASGTAGVDIDGRQASHGGLGKASTVVAVIDDGIDFNHPELAARAWTNPGEAGAKATNGKDDDGNGYIDDVHGWDFCNDDKTVHDANQDWHGTHVAGTIAASLDGKGVVGVAPGIKLMALKFIDNGSFCGLDSMAIDAIDYAASFGVRIINASWGGEDPSPVLDSAIASSGALFVAAAGNYGLDLDSGGPKFYPAASTVPTILSVAAIDQTGHLADFSDYGKTSVDLSAPGTEILSTYPAVNGCPSPCYAWSAGTSMAAPHVSGVAALIGSYASTLLGDPIRLRARVLSTARPLAATTGKTATGRLVNAFRAMDLWAPVAAKPDRFTVATGTVVGSTTVKTTVAWPSATDVGTGVSSYALTQTSPSGTTTLTSGTPDRSRVATLTYGSGYTFGLRARDAAGNVGAAATSPAVTTTLHQSGTALATYGSGWSSVKSSTASMGYQHTSSKAGSSMTFSFTGRSVAIVSPKSSSRGSMKVYVDGTLISTVSLYRSSTLTKSVVFSRGWTSSGTHVVKVVVVGTSGHARVDIDAFVVVR